MSVRVLVFDLYGTLLDVDSVAHVAETIFPGKGERLSEIWRQKQLEYSWLLTLMGDDRDFEAVTRLGLRYALTALGLEGGPAIEARLLASYDRLRVFPDVEAFLEAMRDRVPLAVLSNGTPRMLSSALESAGIRGFFSAVLSAATVKKHKPHPDVYRLVTERFGVSPEAVGFVSSNAWDAHGAAGFGFRAFWVNRKGAPAEALGGDVVEVGSLSALSQEILPELA